MIQHVIVLYKSEAKFRFDVNSTTLVTLTNLVQTQLWLNCRPEFKQFIYRKALIIIRRIQFCYLNFRQLLLHAQETLNYQLNCAFSWK